MITKLNLTVTRRVTSLIMLKIFAIALVFLNVFAAGKMRAEAHVRSTGKALQHVHAIHQSSAEAAAETHQGEPDISYNCCVGAATHCGASILSTLQFVPHGLFQRALDRSPIDDTQMQRRLPASPL